MAGGSGTDTASRHRNDPEVVRRLLATAATSDRAIVAPLYSADSGRNPVVVGRAAWPLIEQLSGDRGLGPIMDATPELVAWVPVTGRNPDVDEPADLAAVASASPGSFRADRPADASADRSTEPA
jgi:CTP:molybdopterin cytidylyltransferase MocA